MANIGFYRLCCKGFRPMLWTVVCVLTLNLLYRGLLLLDGQGTLKRHGFNFTIPKFSLRYKKPLTARVPEHHLLDNPAFCSANPNLLAVALVPSRIEDSHLRQITRKSWGSALSENIPIGVVFLVGTSAEKSQLAAVRKESRKHKDIIQGDYGDHKEASKMLSGLLWMGLKCFNVPFTIFASDKILLDVFILKSFLEEVLQKPEQQATIFGYLQMPEQTTTARTESWKTRLGHFMPEVTEPPVHMPPYLKGEAWFGKTDALLRLLGGVGTVGLIDPVSAYFTGLLANSVDLHRSPMLFNSWWAVNKTVDSSDIGTVMGWLNEGLSTPRIELWGKVKGFHYQMKPLAKKPAAGNKKVVKVVKKAAKTPKNAPKTPKKAPVKKKSGKAQPKRMDIKKFREERKLQLKKMINPKKNISQPLKRVNKLSKQPP